MMAWTTVAAAGERGVALQLHVGSRIWKLDLTWVREGGQEYLAGLLGRSGEEALCYFLVALQVLFTFLCLCFNGISQHLCLNQKDERKEVKSSG